jgi:transcriptional regulator with XRE-family HTH domain
MIPNKKYILDLLEKNNWSQNKLAIKAGVSKTTVSRWINGKRGAGKNLIAGLIRAFPNEPLDKLFFLDDMLPNSNEQSKINLNGR